MAVETIGCEVGYEDIAYFRRLFRRLNGMMPAQYHRNFRLPPTCPAIAWLSARRRRCLPSSTRHAVPQLA